MYDEGADLLQRSLAAAAAAISIESLTFALTINLLYDRVASRAPLWQLPHQYRTPFCIFYSSSQTRNTSRNEG